MMTPKNVKARTALDYYKKGYYKDGKWLGKGAACLGLKGEIKNSKAYENIVKGLSPDGKQRLSKREVHSDKRKAAVDCTFAAPKSVSLCALVGGDERLILAHEKAVEKVLQQMEALYAQTRVMTGQKKQEVVKTRNLVIAKYDHIESRALDPHLHSHCLVMNMTQLPNGEWYSHLNDAIFRNQKLLGMTYQHYLAMEVQTLGYEVEPREHGQFDIKGYSEADLKDFSKRRQQILSKAGADASWAEREKAWKKTRSNKENVSPDELKARWKDEAAALGIEIVKPGVPKPELSSEVEQKIFDDAIKYCSERQIAFKAEDIRTFILSESKPLDVEKIQPLIDSSDELIRIKEKDGFRYTTVAAVERELATINLMKAGQGRVNAIAHPEIIEAHLEQTELNAGQRQAVMMTLFTTDQFIAWQGVAGAGKTYALKEVEALVKAKGYTVVKGFAPNAKASRVLGKDLKAETQTVARLLNSKLPKQIQPNQIWIVDEAGLLSAKDAHRLLKRASFEQARVILVGDTKQLSAVEAGNPFKSLQQAGIETAYLHESRRQKDSPELKLAIDLLAEGRVEAGFARLGAIECIQEVARETKTEEIVNAYFNASSYAQAKTLVLAGTNKERIGLTRALRGALQAQGRLGSDVKLTQLKSKDLRQVQLGYTSHFAVGDMVMPLRDYKRLGLEKGELYEVLGRTTDTIKIKAADGRQLEVDLNFKKTVFEPEEIEIAVGDRLMWKKNNHKKQQVNGDEVTVLAVNGNAVHVLELNGKEHILDLNKPHHLDHAIVRTTYSSQGETADRVLIAADSTIGQESFYVAASRARLELCFFTEDKTKLKQWAVRSRAQENPLEIIKNQVAEQIGAEQLVGVGQSKTTPQTASVSPPPPIKHTTASPASSASTHSTPPPVKRAAANQPTQLPIPKPVKRTQSKPNLTQTQPNTSPPIPRPVPKPIPTEPFFAPTSSGEPPTLMEEKHWRELVEGSAINPVLASRNVRSLGWDAIEQEHEAWEYLMYSDKLERTNTGRLSSGIIKCYRQIEHGGWWADAGIDAKSLPDLKPGESPKLKLWGCFKPDQPRVDNDKSERKGKPEYIKYEHPLKEERQLFLFDVPDDLAQRIYDKYGIQPTQAEKQSGFWYITYKYNLPITLAEGAKKTLSSLSQGEITIGVSGVNGGYLANDKEQNRLSERILHPELKVLATPGREFRFAFDQDNKESTVWNVRRDMVRTGELLELEGCSVRVVQWQGDKGKGLDDLIVNAGALAYTDAVSNSIPLAWEAQKHYRAEYTKLSKKVLGNQPDLSDEAFDIEAYKRAVLKGDLRDGARTIAQSNTARLFKATMPRKEATEKTRLYIQQIENLVFRHGKQPQPDNFDQRTELLLDNSVGQQPKIAHSTNQSNEQNYGINIQESQLDIAANRDSHNRCDGLVDREDHAVGSQQHQINGEDRFPGEQQQPASRENQRLGIQSDRESERVENQSQQLSTTTSRHLEQQEAEPDRAAVEGFNRSSTERRLPSRVATQFSGAVERQDSASPDGAASHGGIERQTGIVEQQTTRQYLDAISDYTEAVSVESQKLSQTLIALANNLRCYQHPDLTRAIQGLETVISNDLKQLDHSKEHTQTDEQTLDAIATYLTAEVVETALARNLEELSRQFNQLPTLEATQTPSLQPQAHDQTIEAIAEYIGQDQIESALGQNLASLTKQLHQLTKLVFAKAPKEYQQTHKQILETISNYIAGEAVESNVAQHLESLARQLSQLPRLETQTQQQVIDAIASYIATEAVEAATVLQLKNLIQQLSQREAGMTNQAKQHEEVKYPQTEAQIIEAITSYVELEAVEAANITQHLESLVKQLKQLPQQGTQTDSQLLDAIALHAQVNSVEANLSQKLESLTKQLGQLPYSEFTVLLQKLEAVVVDNRSKPDLAAIEAINAHIESASVEDELTPPLKALIELTKELQPTSSEQADNQAIDAIARYIEQSAVKSSLDPQTLKNLTEALEQHKPSKLTAQMRQLEAVVNEVGIRLQKSALTQAVERVAEAISSYHEPDAIDEAITQELQHLVQDLTQRGESNLPERLEQLGSVIEQYRQRLEVHPKIKPDVIESSTIQPTVNIHQQPLFTADIKAVAAKSPETPAVTDVDATSLTEVELQQLITAELTQLNDRDFHLLHESVAEYFRNQPPPLPVKEHRQQVENEFKQLSSQLERLHEVLAQQQAVIESMQSNPFRTWNRSYQAALAAAEQTLGQISTSLTRKQHCETQIAQWEQQAKAYQAWDNDPKTVEMRTLATVLESPQMQQRLNQINQEFARSEALRQRLSQSQNNTQQRRHGRGW